MASENRVRLVAEITATSKGLVDAMKQASNAVNSTTQDWKGKFASLKDATGTIGQSVKNLSDLISKVGDVDMDVQGMDKVRDAISSVSGSFEQVRGEVDSFVAKLVDMRNEASSLGMPLEEFSRFSTAVQNAGLTMEEAKGMVQSMQQQIQALANGVPEAQATFSKLGLTIEQLSSNTVTGNLQEITRAINETIPASERATQNMEMFKSAIDKTLAVSEQYSKAVSTQSGSYASDKDLQNAISMQNVLNRLGEQLTSYSASAQNAGKASSDASRAFLDMFDAIKKNQNLLSELYTVYASYVDSLKGSVSSTLDASSAIEVFSVKCMEALDASTQVVDKLEELRASGKKPVVTLDTDNAVSNINNLVNFVVQAKDKILEEMTAVHGIMNQRIEAGAPIDMKELETAQQHVRDLRNGLDMLRDAASQIGFELPKDALNDMTVLDLQLDAAQRNFRKLNETATEMNASLGFDKAVESVDSLIGKLGRLGQVMADGRKVTIDTSELDKAEQAAGRLEELLMSRNYTIDSSGMQVFRDEVASVTDRLLECRTGIEGVSTSIGGLDPSAVNRVMEAFRQVEDSLVAIVPKEESVRMSADQISSSVTDVQLKFLQLQRLLSTLGKSHSISIDTRRLDEAFDRLNQIDRTVIRTQVDTTEIDKLRDKIRQVRSGVADYNRQVERGTPIWQPMVNLVGKLRTGINGVMASARNCGSAFRAVGAAIKACWNYVVHFKGKVNEASGSAKGLGSLLRHAGGQLLGMGTAVAVITKAWQNLTAVVKAYAENVEYARKMSMWGNLQQGAESLGESRNRQEQRFANGMAALKQFAELYDEEQKTGDLQTKARRVNMQEQMKVLYNLEFDMTGDQIKDLDRQVAAKINELKETTLSMIESNMTTNQQLINGTRDYINSFHYLRRLLTVDEEGKIQNAQEAQNKATNENMSLRQTKFEMERTDYAQQWLLERQGKKIDDKSKERGDAEKEARKAEEERVRKLKDGVKKLEEWQNATGDTERQKAIRQILRRYEELVDAGVNEQDARNAAIADMAKLLQKEREEEQRKNDELLKVYQERIDAYRDALKNYRDAERSLRDARLDYAKTQKELAREARAERIQRRRDRIQRRMSRFGFTLPDGFRLNETPRERRGRIRDTRIDNSIEDKLAQRAEGRRVHWTRRESERLEAFLKLRGKDRQLEAAQRQMQAADRTASAADRLSTAADAVKSAVGAFQTARVELAKAWGEVAKTRKNRRTMSEELPASEVFDRARRQGVRAKGVAEPARRRSYGYPSGRRQSPNVPRQKPTPVQFPYPYNMPEPAPEPPKPKPEFRLEVPKIDLDPHPEKVEKPIGMLKDSAETFAEAVDQFQKDKQAEAAMPSKPWTPDWWMPQANPNPPMFELPKPLVFRLDEEGALKEAIDGFLDEKRRNAPENAPETPEAPKTPQKPVEPEKPQQEQSEKPIGMLKDSATVFSEAVSAFVGGVNKPLEAPGVMPTIAQNIPDYAEALNQIHTDLQKIVNGGRLIVK